MDFDIPKDYFLDEVRDGFFVPSMIKKSWAVSIIDYKILEQICDKLGLNIFFMYGSLIAVIRHAGSIPWDDDIDSMMFHDEYQRLKVFLDNGGLPENFRMNDYTQMGTGNLVRKWLDNVDAIKNRDRWEESFGFPFVNNIDVMLIDYLPDGEKNMQYYRDVVELLQYVKDFADAIEAGSENYDKAEFEYSLDLLERVLKVKYDKEKDGRLSIWTWKMLDEFTARYTARDGSEVASVAHYMTHGNGKFPKRFYQGYIDMPYEFTTVKVPVGYDGITKNFFGDYMTPKLEWDGHIYPFYRNLETALREKFDIELLKYHYRESEVSKVLEERVEKISFSDTLAYSTDLFKEAHGFICEVLSTEGETTEETVQEVLGVLGSCQELAVNLGEAAEKQLVDGVMTERIVSELEKYCEYVYGLYQSISGEADFGSDIGSIRVRFDGFESFLGDILSEDIKEKIKVVFLCWRSKYWSSLHTVWEAAMEDEEADVTVIAVPYYIKDYEGRISKDDIIIDTEEYFESVELTPYDEYDFEAEHPDIVIYQEPYDEYSDAFTIHPYYYSSNIRKYTEKMVFIPPFVVREVSSGDERSKYTLGCFACNPGLVFADMVIVQSEGMRDVYISVLSDMIKRDVRYTMEDWSPDVRQYESTDYAGEEKELIEAYSDYVPEDDRVARYINWKNKILPLGSALTDWNNRTRIIIRDESSKELYDKSGKPVIRTAYDEIVDVPDEWISKLKKPDGSLKKILLYNISAGVAFEYGTEVFEKAESAINMIDRDHADDMCALVFADRNYRDALRKNNPSAWSSCQRFISFIKSSNHIYDDSLDEHRAALICDACYGDASSVMNKCRELGRPVMLQAPDIKIYEE